MAYDPFAPVPDPSVVPTDFTATAVPLAANNALATVAPNGNPGVVPPQMRGHMPFDVNGFMQAMQTWQNARPDRPTFDTTTGSPDDWRTQIDAFHTAMRDWAHSHPSPRDYRSGMTAPAPVGSGTGVAPAPMPMPMPPTPMPPVMMPGGGHTGAPLPGTGVGMVPGVPGSVGLNPGAPNPGGNPKFVNDWRSLVPALPAGMPTRGFRPGG
jgi:hypothetical protein